MAEAEADTDELDLSGGEVLGNGYFISNAHAGQLPPPTAGWFIPPNATEAEIQQIIAYVARTLR